MRMRNYILLLLLFITSFCYGQMVAPSIGSPTSKTQAGGYFTARQMVVPGLFVIIPFWDSTGSLAVINGYLWYHTGQERKRVATTNYVDSAVYGIIGGGVTLPQLNDSTYELRKLIWANYNYLDSEIRSAFGAIGDSFNARIATDLNSPDNYHVLSTAAVNSELAKAYSAIADTSAILRAVFNALLIDVWNEIDTKQDQLNGHGLVRQDGLETSYDNSNYLTTAVKRINATGGTGINVSGGPITDTGTLIITNIAPDQTVTLSQGAGIGISGTYPNFTITNISPSSGGTVTTVTVNAANGFAGTVVNSTTTPAITITTTVNGIPKGNGTALTPAVAGTDYMAPTLQSGYMWVGSAGNVATGTPMSGDGTLSSTGAMTLTSTGIASGTYGSSSVIAVITYDAKGRATAITTTNISTATVITTANFTTSYTIAATDSRPILITITAQAGGLLFNAPTGLTDGQLVLVRIKATGGSRTLSYNAAFGAITGPVAVPLPTTATTTAWLNMQFIYNSTDSKLYLTGTMSN